MTLKLPDLVLAAKLADLSTQQTLQLPLHSCLLLPVSLLLALFITVVTVTVLIFIITSDEGGYVFTSVCLSVCLSVG